MNKSGCKSGITRVVVGFLAAASAAAAMSGQATSPSIRVTAVAEVEVRSLEDGRDVVRLAPAERAVPGDQVIYTLEVRNPGQVSIASPEVVYAIPPHMAFVADSAAGPGADVTYSIDSGQTFDRPEYLRATTADGVVRAAPASAYTHIRWKFKHSLKPKSIAYARFRVQVK